METIQNSNFSSISKVLLALGHAYSCPYDLWLLSDYDSRVITSETIRPSKLELFTVWPFIEKVCCPPPRLKQWTGAPWDHQRPNKEGEMQEGRTYMRLKRPSKSGGGAKEKAGDRGRVGWGGGFPHLDARRALAPLSLVLGTTVWKMCRVTLVLSPALFDPVFLSTDHKLGGRHWRPWRPLVIQSPPFPSGLAGAACLTSKEPGVSLSPPPNTHQFSKSQVSSSI